MLLEQVEFLKSSIQSAREEVWEEIEALKEGADVELSLTTIGKILDDLFHSSENPEIHIEKKEISSTRLPEEIVKEDLYAKFEFDIGEEVYFIGQVFEREENISHLRAIFGYSSDEDIRSQSLYLRGEKVVIVGKVSPETHLLSSENIYVVEFEGRKYFTGEYDLEKL